MILLALDLATTTGFVVGDPAGYRPLTAIEAAAQRAVGGDAARKPYSGAKRIGAKGARIGDFLCAYGDWLNDLCTVHAVTHLVFEAPWVGPKTHQDTARKLMCLAGHTEYVAARRAIGWVREVNIAQVRKHFVGRGAGLARQDMKVLVLAACRARGWDIVSEDEADALAVFDYAVACIRIAERA